VKFIPKTKDGIALTCVSIIAFSFFIAGIFDILNNFIVQLLIFLLFGCLLAVAIGYAFKNEHKKNRLEDKLQDDSH
tara:strand:+ start:1201 stop:1428 length:228 start_codon:yes stop_codon:yes gene_type:complete